MPDGAIQAGGPLLSVRGMSLRYRTARGEVQALDDVSFAIPRGRAMGLVGESGSGKSSVVLALLGLLGPEATLTALARHLSTSVNIRDGRTYAGGLTKFEPREMERLLVPEPSCPV